MIRRADKEVDLQAGPNHHEQGTFDMAENGITAHACETINNTLPDGAILDAWERRKAAWARWSALPDSPVAHATAEEAECIAIVDAAEIAICNEIATTPAGIAIQLWISIDYSADAQASGMAGAIHREDIGAVMELSGELDWGTRLLVAAIRSALAQGVL